MENKPKKMIFVATVPSALNFFRGQLRFLGDRFEVKAVSSGGPMLREVGEREGIEVIETAMEREISLGRDIRSLYALTKVFRRERPGIIHGNTPKGALLSMTAARLCHVPCRIYMCHGLRYQSEKGALRRLLMAMEKIACACSTEVIAVSEGVRSALESDGICRRGKAKVILNGSPNGIDGEYFRRENFSEESLAGLRAEYGIGEKDFVYCFTGRITRDKGISELLEAFDMLCAKYNDVKLLLIGNWEQEASAMTPAACRTVAENVNIIQPGFQTDVRPFMAASDVVVLPSYREGLPTVVLEAGAIGVPVIVSDTTGCRDAVEEGVSGIFTEPKNKDALAGAMESIYCDGGLRESLARKARGSVLHRFGQEELWNAYLTEYESLSQRKRGK